MSCSRFRRVDAATLTGPGLWPHPQGQERQDPLRAQRDIHVAVGALQLEPLQQPEPDRAAGRHGGLGRGPPNVLTVPRSPGSPALHGYHSVKVGCHHGRVRLPQSTDPRPRNVGILLAAGAGRRYGKPKVLVNGWLDTAVAALRDGGCADVVLVLGAAEVAPPRGVTAITARYWHEGLSASVRAGLMQADGMHADYAVLHVIDTPDVGAAVVSRVLGRALSSESGLARAYFGGRPGHPVVIARRHWPEVLALISEDRGAGAYLSTRRDVEIVDCADLAGGQDIDEL
jgi:molybdenum cofactor cytidylyltransferase